MNTTTTNKGTATLPTLQQDRLAAGMTQLQLAVAADVALGTVRNAEAGLKVTADVRGRIGQALGRSLAEAA